jgi:hypothetical protein
MVGSPHGTTLWVVPSRKMRSIFRGLHAPGNMTDDYRVYPGGYQPDFIEEPGLGFDSQI